MKITLIGAMARNRTIGNAGELPWKGKMRADMAHFVEKTTGKPVIMGRTTFESIGRPLPNRKNIVISTKKDLALPGVTVVHSKEDAIRACAPAPEIMVIGGEQIYAMFLSDAECMLLTIIHADFDGDAHFPEYDENDWRLVSSTSHGEDKARGNEYSYTFRTFERMPK